jgi:hypothetical protein
VGCIRASLDAYGNSVPAFCVIRRGPCRLRRSEIKAKLITLGFYPVGLRGAYLRGQYDEYGRVIREANIKGGVTPDYFVQRVSQLYSLAGHPRKRPTMRPTFRPTCASIELASHLILLQIS